TGVDNSQPTSAGNAMTGPMLKARRATRNNAATKAGVATNPRVSTSGLGIVAVVARTTASATRPPPTKIASNVSVEGTICRQPPCPRTGRANRRTVRAPGLPPGGHDRCSTTGHVHPSIGNGRNEFCIVRGEQHCDTTFLLMLQRPDQPACSGSIKILRGLVEHQQPTVPYPV